MNHMKEKLEERAVALNQILEEQNKDSAGEISDQTSARSFSEGRVPLLEKRK